MRPVVTTSSFPLGDVNDAKNLVKEAKVVAPVQKIAIGDVPAV